MSAEEANILNLAEMAEEDNSSGKVLEDAENVLNEVTDAICPDTAYLEALDQAEAEEAARDEAAKDKIIDKVIVYAVTRAIENKENVETEIREKFASIGVKVIDMKTKSNFRGLFEKCLVDVSPVNLKLIWGRRLGLKNCSAIAYEE